MIEKGMNRKGRTAMNNAKVANELVKLAKELQSSGDDGEKILKAISDMQTDLAGVGIDALNFGKGKRGSQMLEEALSNVVSSLGKLRRIIDGIARDAYHHFPKP